MKKITIIVLLFYSGMTLAQIKVGNNVESISPYAALEIESDDKGLLISRMTDVERDNAFDQSAPVGLMIFNTDANALQYFMEEIDPTSKRKTGLKIWQTTSSQTDGGTTLPNANGASTGDLFFNTQEQILYFFDGSQWIPVAGNTQIIQNSTVFEGNNITYTQTDGTTTTLDLGHLNTMSDTDSQTLSLSTANPTVLEISNGNSVDLAPIINTLISNATPTTTSTGGTQGPAGPAGATGAAGAAGAAGTNGAGFLVAAGIPSSSVASPTYYVNSTNGDQYYNTGGGSTWTPLPSSTNQTLTAGSLSATNTLDIGISNGNTVTLDLSTLTSAGSTTDSQTLTYGSSATPTATTLAISGGNALNLRAGGVLTFAQTSTDTLELNVPASAVTNTDSQTLTYGGSATSTETTLEIIDGNALTLQASGSLTFTQQSTDTLILTALSETVSASVIHSTQRYDGSEWVQNDSLLSDGSTQATVTTKLTVAGETTLLATTTLATTTLTAALLDASGSAGTPGQFLSATTTGTAWITTTAAGSIQLQTANYMASIDDGTILVEPTAATTITLPSLSTADNGKKITIKRANVYNGPSDTLVISAPDTIEDQGVGLDLNVSYQGYTLQAFAGEWHIIQRF